jgi:hypothetical protein
MNAASPAWLTSTLHWLFKPRPREQELAGPPVNRFGWPEALVLALYAAILAFAIPQHRPWCDEAQAWLLARDCSLHDLLLRRMHYEGGPGLWPTILWIAIRLHLPFSGLNWLAGTFALGGIALLLRFSPFPRIFRYLLPFTFFLQYQYAVIARPYVLVPSLICLLCTTFTLRRPRPLLFAIAAGLLANISLHAALTAGAFFVLYLHRLYRARSPRDWPARPSASCVPAVAVFCVLAACSVIVAFPAPDVALTGHPGQPLMTPNPVLLQLMPPEKVPQGMPPLDSPIDALPVPAKPAPTGLTAVIVRIIVALILSADALCYPISTSDLVVVAFLGLLFVWLRRRNALSTMLPCLTGIAGSVLIWVHAHHTGIFLLALVAAIWIALETPTPQPDTAPRPDSMPKPGRARHGIAVPNALTAVALLVVLLQIGWSAHCILSERSTPYDPGRETEAFLRQHFAGKRIAGFTFESVTTQAYSDHNLFFNQPHSFWVWSIPVLIDRRRTEAFHQHPDVVVVADFIPGDDGLHNQWILMSPKGVHPYHLMLEYWQAHGYEVTQRFCGNRVSRMGITNTLCEDILVPKTTAQPPISKAALAASPAQ